MSGISLFYRKLFHNRLNIIKTLAINLLCLPISDSLTLPILIYGPCKLIIPQRRRIRLIGSPALGRIKVGLSDPVRSYGKYTYLQLEGEMEIGYGTIIRRGVHMQIAKEANVRFGSNCSLGDNTTFIAKKEIIFKNNVRIGNDCTIMDSDFHYVLNLNEMTIKNNSATILIYENCWISGYNVIKKGAILPAGCIVAGPFSMIGKNYLGSVKENSLLAGCPATVKYEGVERILSLDVESKISLYFKKHNCSRVSWDNIIGNDSKE